MRERGGGETGKGSQYTRQCSHTVLYKVNNTYKKREYRVNGNNVQPLYLGLNRDIEYALLCLSKKCTVPEKKVSLHV